MQDNFQQLITLLGGSLLKMSALFWMSRKVPEYRPVGKVSGLIIYPVKSCRGIRYNEVDCTSTGPQVGYCKDRRWVLVSSGKRYIVTMVKENMMALVTPSFHGDELHLDAPNKETLILPVSMSTDTNEVITLKMSGQDLQAMDCGDEAAEWFSSFLNKPDAYRLMYAGDMVRDMHGADYKFDNLHEPESKAGFAYFSQYHVISQTSLDDLNSKMDTPVRAEHFRPNLIIEECETPFEEDYWTKVKIGDTRFMKLKLTNRCLITTVNVESGEKSKTTDPLKTLKGYRQRTDIKGFGSSPCFGTNLAPIQTGQVAVGDLVYAIMGDAN